MMGTTGKTQQEIWLALQIKKDVTAIKNHALGTYAVHLK